jgi:methionyl aminopeptidase
MIIVKGDDDIISMRRAGRITAEVLAAACGQIVAGISTGELDEIVAAELIARGAKSACLGYGRKDCPFPSHACISLNDEIVHGIPSKGRIVRNGDIVSIDLVADVDGFMGDSTRTIAVGDVDASVARLLAVTEAALQRGIAAARPGNRVGDISFAIEQMALSEGFAVIKELVGHGIGRDMHEDPQIPNWGAAKSGPALAPGMTLAIEPMFALGDAKIKFFDDGWTVSTFDGMPAAHFEHTILVTKSDPEILTVSEK